MNGFKKFLSILAVMLCIGALSYATDISVQRFVVGPNDTQIWKLDDDGDVTQAGNITASSATLATIGVTSTVTASTVTLSGGFLPSIRTIAQFNALTASTTGQVMLCSDCVRSALCVSSGTTTGAWVIAVGSGSFVGSTFSGFAHCL